jgi:pimeloyl-ACP methyl ester carboxylesterase
MTMPTLKVPGADLHYEAVGHGPMLLAIHGGDGRGGIWRDFSEALGDRFMVVFYDRESIATLFWADRADKL